MSAQEPRPADPSGLFAPNGRPITHEYYGLAYQAPVERLCAADRHPDNREVRPGVTVRMDYDRARSMDGVLFDRAADGTPRRWMDDQGNLWTAAELLTAPPAPETPLFTPGGRQPRLDLAHLTFTPATLSEALLDLGMIPLAHLSEAGLYFAIDGQEHMPVLVYDVLDPVTQRCEGVFLFNPAAMEALPMSHAARTAAGALRAYMDQALVNAGGHRGDLQPRPLTLADLHGVLNALTPDVLREWDEHLFTDSA